MRVRCPHCHSPLEILPESSVASVVCPSCGSGLDGVNETLISIKPETRLLGRFELIQCVGKGYFGEVWKARDLDLRQTVAVKIPRTQDLTEEYRERFLREARTTAQLRHDNIVRVLEVGRDEETLFIVSDFIDGMTLADRILNQRLDVTESAQLCATLAQALHHAHEAGIVHRDLKPSNVMLDKSNKPYLVDFGLAKQDSGGFSMTATGDILGTPAYMSPEQARGDSHNADRRSDVYSLGVVLYELLTGERPFKGSTHLLLKAIQQLEPAPPSKINPQLPKDIETICLKAMSKEPHRRYATALEMAEDLQRFLNGESILARRTSSFERGWRWIRRNPYLSVACATAALATIGMIGALASKPVALSGQVTPMKNVSIDTIPTGAKVVFYPLSPVNGEVILDKAIRPTHPTPVAVSLYPSDYLVVAESPDAAYTFHEVYRRVPSHTGVSKSHAHLRYNVGLDGTIILPEIQLPSATVIDGMAHLSGAEDFVAGDATMKNAPPYQRAVSPFWMDCTEVTVGQIQTMMIDLKIDAPPMPFHFMPKEGRTGELPITHASYDDAVALAEKLGKRLPTEFEYEFAATNGGRTRFPWGDDPKLIQGWSFGPMLTTAPWDRTQTTPVIKGLYSNLVEWTTDWEQPYPVGKSRGVTFDSITDQRIVRGGSPSVISTEPHRNDWAQGPRTRMALNRTTFSPVLGFRCVRSDRPR